MFKSMERLNSFLFGEHVPFVEQLPFLGDFIKWEVGISSWNVTGIKPYLIFTERKISA